ncbi:MAG: NYN domain-containing protein [Candidatus Omnitrophota bacterium]
MSLHYIIDGYNLIHHPLFARLNKKTECQENALLNFIRVNKLCGKSGSQATVVFDGYKDLSRQGFLPADIDVVFSRRETADTRIKRMIEAAANPKNLVVISDDKEIIFFVRQVRAHPMAVEEFLFRSPQGRKLQADQQKKSKSLEEDPGPKVSYSQMQKINQEMRKIWLR